MELWLTVNGKRTCASAPLDPLTRAVVISLFTWRRAEPDDNADVPMGWWGDTWPAVQNDRYGSRLWLLQRSKLTNQLVQTVRGYIRECLQWMIDDGVVSRIDLDTGDDFMDVTNDDYIRLLSALLPPGPAWSASDPAIAGAAQSLTRVHQRADALMRELDPRTTTELINRWERLCGLPDECIPTGTQTLRQRQQRLDAKVNLAGGINEDFYLAQLAALGRPDATITRYDKSTFTCSSACTDAVNAPEWRYYWQVNMPAATNTTWMTCGDPCDSALRIWGDTVVECVLNKLCPSHTYVIFKYPE